MPHEPPDGAGLLDCIFVESLCDVYAFNEIK